MVGLVHSLLVSCCRGGCLRACTAVFVMVRVGENLYPVRVCCCFAILYFTYQIEFPFGLMGWFM
jgi:hypothetical protein